MLETIYNTAAGRRCKGFLEIKNDIKYIRDLVNHYSDNHTFTKTFDGADPSKVYDASEIIPMNCVFITIIILYGRCFTSAEGRGVKLEKNFLKNANDEINNTHIELMEIRNKFVAHAGNTPLESFELLIKYGNRFSIEESKENFQALAGQIVEKERMLPLLDALQTEIDNTVEKIRIKLGAELDILEKKLPVFLKKAMNKQPITDEDIR